MNGQPAPTYTYKEKTSPPGGATILLLPNIFSQDNLTYTSNNNSTPQYIDVRPRLHTLTIIYC